MARLLIVDDDTVCLHYLAVFLRDAGHDVVTSAKGPDGIALGFAVRPDVLITDWLLDDVTCNGLDVAVALQAAIPRMKVIFMTGLLASTITDLRGLTATKILEKPLTYELLARAILAHISVAGT